MSAQIEEIENKMSEDEIEIDTELPCKIEPTESAHLNTISKVNTINIREIFYLNYIRFNYDQSHVIGLYFIVNFELISNSIIYRRPLNVQWQNDDQAD